MLGFFVSLLVSPVIPSGPRVRALPCIPNVLSENLPITSLDPYPYPIPFPFPSPSPFVSLSDSLWEMEEVVSLLVPPPVFLD